MAGSALGQEACQIRTLLTRLRPLRLDCCVPRCVPPLDDPAVAVSRRLFDRSREGLLQASCAVLGGECPRTNAGSGGLLRTHLRTMVVRGAVHDGGVADLEL